MALKMPVAKFVVEEEHRIQGPDIPTVVSKELLSGNQLGLPVAVQIRKHHRVDGWIVPLYPMLSKRSLASHHLLLEPDEAIPMRRSHNDVIQAVTIHIRN